MILGEFARILILASAILASAPGQLRPLCGSLSVPPRSGSASPTNPISLDFLSMPPPTLDLKDLKVME